MGRNGAVAGRRRFEYLDRSLGLFYADVIHRLLLYFLLAVLFMIGGLLALALYRGPGVLISNMSFTTVYALHTSLVFTLCHFGVDFLVARLWPSWGGYGRRTVGQQWLIWAGGLAVALVVHRTLVRCLVHLYAPEVIEYYRSRGQAHPSHLSVVLYGLPYWAAASWLAITVALKRQRRLASTIFGGKPLASQAGRADGSLEIQVDGVPRELPYEKITHITVEDHYCRIHYISGQGRRDVLIRHPLQQMSRKLPDDRFVQVHRSHVVNLDHVTGLTRRGRSLRIVLGDVQLPLSRHRRPQVHPRLSSAIEDRPGQV
jgi:hypothetical protein